MKTLLLLCLALVCGCASQRVRCDRHLEPINASAATPAAAPAPDALAGVP